MSRETDGRWKNAVMWLGILVLLTPFIVYQFPFLAGADKAYVVMSGSMEPEIETGSVVFTEHVDPDNISVGDVITFQHDDDKQPTTHRVINISTEKGQPVFETKGDANDTPDFKPVHPEDVTGAATFSIPFLGYILVWAGSRIGIIVLILVPASLIVLSELRTIHQELMQ